MVELARRGRRERARGQPVAIVETDKADVEVEAHADGVIRIVAAPGDVVAVETAIARIGAADAAPATPSGGITAADLAAGTPPAGSFAAVGGAPTAQAPAAAVAPVSAPAGDRVFVSPSARRRARELGVDARRRDAGAAPAGASCRPTSRSTPQRSELRPRQPATALPRTSLRPAARAVADLRPAVVAALVSGWQSIPHVNIGGELDAEGLVAARAATGGGALRVTYTDLLLLALARALSRRARAGGDDRARRRDHTRAAHRPESRHATSEQASSRR